jgi:hypothetical protein
MSKSPTHSGTHPFKSDVLVNFVSFATQIYEGVGS